MRILIRWSGAVQLQVVCSDFLVLQIGSTMETIDVQPSSVSVCQGGTFCCRWLRTASWCFNRRWRHPSPVLAPRSVAQAAPIQWLSTRRSVLSPLVLMGRYRTYYVSPQRRQMRASTVQGSAWSLAELVRKCGFTLHMSSCSFSNVQG